VNTPPAANAPAAAAVKETPVPPDPLGLTGRRTASTTVPSASALVAPADPKAFNPVAAKASLDLVNGILASCRSPNGQRGDGVIGVTFANDGTVSRALIDEPPFVGTTEGQCVQSRFKHARTTPFEGPPGTMVYTFHISK
jgi:hypothetical protein